VKRNDPNHEKFLDEDAVRWVIIALAIIGILSLIPRLIALIGGVIKFIFGIVWFVICFVVGIIKFGLAVITTLVSFFLTLTISLLGFLMGPLIVLAVAYLLWRYLDSKSDNNDDNGPRAA